MNLYKKKIEDEFVNSDNLTNIVDETHYNKDVLVWIVVQIISHERFL